MTDPKPRRGRPPGRAAVVAMPLRLPPEVAQELAAHAERTGEARNSIATRAIKALLKRECR